MSIKTKIGGLIVLLIALIGFAATTTSVSASTFPLPNAAKPTPTNPPPVPLPLFLALTPGSGQANNIFSFTNTLNPISNGGVSWMPIPSPAGEWVAYGYIPIFYLKENGARDGFGQPENITLLNVTTNKKETIAGQPTNASLQEGKIAFSLRSFPSWSPDGKKLAWTEINVDQAANINFDLSIEQLVVYDLDTKTTQVIVGHLPAHRFISGAIDPAKSVVAWGPGGIAVQVASSELDSGFIVYVYTPEGKLISQTSEDTVQVGFDNGQMIWVKNGNADMVTTVGGSLLIDPLTGNLYTNPGTDELYNPRTPHGLSLYFGSDPGNDASLDWLIAKDGKPIQMLSGIIITSSFGAAISPDGKQAAFMVYQGQGSAGTISLYKNGKVRDLGVTSVSGIAWSAPVWRVNMQGNDF